MERTVAGVGKGDRGGAGVGVGLYVPACRKERGHSKTFLPGCMRVGVSGARCYSNSTCRDSVEVVLKGF
jgi:hypothetical protein